MVTSKHSIVVVDDLTVLSLDELSRRYMDIHNQSQLMKGFILLEARERLTSNNEFGDWVDVHGLSVDSQQQRTAFMNLARFFKDHSMEGIKMTAAYQISSPSNEDVAEGVYQEVAGKNLSVKAVKDLIKQKKAILSPDLINGDILPASKIIINEKDVDSVVDLTNGIYTSEEDKVQFLKACIKKIRSHTEPITGELV